MNPIIYYLLQVIAASALLYGYYHIALRNKRFHRYNRFYLLSAIVISLLLPFLNIPVYFSNADTESSVILRTLTYISSPGPSAGSDPLISTEITTSHSIQPIDIFYAFYICALTIAILRILFSCIRIRSLARNNPGERIDNITFINTSEPGTPFSFFSWLFWNRAIELRSPKGEQIFKHELFHIRQKHSWDIVFTEIITALFWMNPFFYLLKKEIKMIHEFLADEFAIQEDNNWEYAELLLMQALNTRNQLINPFFHNQVKRRIAMIIHPKKTSHRYLRKLLVLPVAAIVIMLFAFSYKKKDALPVSSIKESGFRISGEFTMTSDTVPKFILREDKTIKSPDTLVWQKSGTKYEYIMLDQKTVPDIKPWDTLHDKPLVVIDGVIIGNLNFTGIDMQLQLIDVKQVNVLKGEMAIKKYGDQGKMGVIEIITIKKSSIEIKEGKETPKPGAGNIIFEKVEVEASFPGGVTQWRHFLERNANGQIATDSGAPAGNYTVIVQFIVDKDGSLHDFKALTKHGFGMEEEAVRVISKGPKWVPAVQNGKIVSAYRKQPITFAVIEDEEDVPPVKPKDTNPVEDNKIFVKTEIEPSFPGGEVKWKAYLEKNCNAMIPVDKGAPAGHYTVFIQFIVDKDGNIHDLKPLTKHGYGMEEEAIRVIRKGPNWEPAKQNGHIVKAYAKQRVDFVISLE